MVHFDVLDPLTQGRELYLRRAWQAAFESLSLADRSAVLAGDDLELLARAAYLIGRDTDFAKTLERAHHVHLEASAGVPAARCAFWLGLHWLLSGAVGPATGWLARAQRLIEAADLDCVERGYLQLPRAEQHLQEGDCHAAGMSAQSAVEIGIRFGDADLVACGLHVQGRALIQQGTVAAGLALLDEAMVAVTAGEVSPIMTGLIYCSVIDACQRVYALGRAREWTTAMADWCGTQPEMVAFTGICLVHRAQVMQLNGAWTDAIDQARSACQRFSEASGQKPPAAGFYQQGEVHRLRGEFAEAELAYRQASLGGCEPQPGLSLLRVAQGRPEAGAAAMQRLVNSVTDRLERMRLLPAHIEILLVVGDVDEARGACDELEGLAQSLGTEVSSAMAAHARGAVELQQGNARGALLSLRRGWELWEQVKAPYLAARVRELLGLACAGVGDEDGKKLELAAARAAFERLGAAPDVARIDSVAREPSSRPRHGLSSRELQVLRLVAVGKTNKVIAAELGLSEKTIERHLSNIFTKLNVASRAAATAYAYDHELVKKAPSVH